MEKSKSEPDIITGRVALPDVQIVFLDREWSSYDYPTPMERKFPATNEHVVVGRYVSNVAIDPRWIEQAVRALLVHHDGLRSRFAQQNSRWIQYIVPPGKETPLIWIDLAPVPASARKQMVQNIVAHEVHSLNLFYGPILKCIFFSGDSQNRDQLFLILSHTMADSISMQILFDDMQTALRQLARGETIRLPDKTTSIKAWSERIEACMQSPEWASILRELTQRKRSWPAPELKTLPLDYVEEKQDERVSGHLQLMLTVRETDALIKQAQSFWHVRLQDLLQTAFYKTIAPWVGVTALPICVVVHGRDPIFDDINLTRTIGPFAMELLDLMVPRSDGRPIVSLWADPRYRFAQVLLNFSRSLEMIYEGGGQEKYISIYEQYRPQVTLNFEGRIGSTSVPGQLNPFQPAPIVSSAFGTSVASKSLDCILALQEKRLLITWQYSPRYFRPQTIRRLADTYMKELEAYIAGS